MTEVIMKRVGLRLVVGIIITLVVVVSIRRQYNAAKEMLRQKALTYKADDQWKSGLSTVGSHVTHDPKDPDDSLDDFVDVMPAHLKNDEETDGEGREDDLTPTRPKTGLVDPAGQRLDETPVVSAKNFGNVEAGRDEERTDQADGGDEEEGRIDDVDSVVYETVDEVPRQESLLSSFFGLKKFFPFGGNSENTGNNRTSNVADDMAYDNVDGKDESDSKYEGGRGLPLAYDTLGQRAEIGPEVVQQLVTQGAVPRVMVTSEYRSDKETAADNNDAAESDATDSLGDRDNDAVKEGNEDHVMTTRSMPPQRGDESVVPETQGPSAGNNITGQQDVDQLLGRDANAVVEQRDRNGLDGQNTNDNLGQNNDGVEGQKENGILGHLDRASPLPHNTNNVVGRTDSPSPLAQNSNGIADHADSPSPLAQNSNGIADHADSPSPLAQNSNGVVEQEDFHIPIGQLEKPIVSQQDAINLTQPFDSSSSIQKQENTDPVIQSDSPNNEDVGQPYNANNIGQSVNNVGQTHNLNVGQAHNFDNFGQSVNSNNVGQKFNPNSFGQLDNSNTIGQAHYYNNVGQQDNINTGKQYLTNQMPTFNPLDISAPQNTQNFKSDVPQQSVSRDQHLGEKLSPEILRILLDNDMGPNFMKSFPLVWRYLVMQKSSMRSNSQGFGGIKHESNGIMSLNPNPIRGDFQQSTLRVPLEVIPEQRGTNSPNLPIVPSLPPLTDLDVFINEEKPKVTDQPNSNDNNGITTSTATPVGSFLYDNPRPLSDNEFALLRTHPSVANNVPVTETPENQQRSSEHQNTKLQQQFATLLSEKWQQPEQLVQEQQQLKQQHYQLPELQENHQQHQQVTLEPQLQPNQQHHQQQQLPELKQSQHKYQQQQYYIQMSERQLQQQPQLIQQQYQQQSQPQIHQEQPQTNGNLTERQQFQQYSPQQQPQQQYQLQENYLQQQKYEQHLHGQQQQWPQKLPEQQLPEQPLTAELGQTTVSDRPAITCPRDVKLAITSHPVTALVAFPGAEAAWVRNILEQLFGEPTDSIYTIMAELKSGNAAPVYQMGKKVAVQTHSASDKNFQRALLLISNPYAVEKQHQMFRPPIQDWQKMYLWGQTYSSWFNSSLPLFVLVYEDLAENPMAELIKLTDFLGTAGRQVSYECALKVARQPPSRIGDVTQITGLYNTEKRRINENIDRVMAAAQNKHPELVARLDSFKVY